jgi:hypothetical protein
MRTRYDREKIFQLLSRQEWTSLIEIFKDNAMYEEIQKDEIAKNVLETAFIRELTHGVSFEKDPDHLFYLEQFQMLHAIHTFKFKLAKKDNDVLVEKIIGLYKDTKFDSALGYAKRYPHLAASVEILTEFERTQPKEVKHSQDKMIKVTENTEIDPVDGTTSLFKSNQEYHFYRALRDVYHSYLVFPNVAVSSILNYELIKDQLSSNEKTYFFKALIDCVVIDPENDFKPYKMLEIDSVYHDSTEQKAKDLMKDKIMAKAGQKLIRIRVTGNPQEQDFRKLILEVTR